MSQSTPAAGADLGAAPFGRPPRILLAEDDEAVRESIAEALREDGYEVIVVENGRDLFWSLAVPTHTHGAVDLVVTDVRMPAYSGLDVLDALATDCPVPKVVMTAFPTQDTLAKAKSLGIALLEKPFPLEHLRVLVHELIAKFRASQA
jgi:CheY-like chemotaxis protein